MIDRQVIVNTHNKSWLEPHMWCLYGTSSREMSVYTVLYGVLIQLWPTQQFTHQTLTDCVRGPSMERCLSCLLKVLLLSAAKAHSRTMHEN